MLDVANNFLKFKIKFYKNFKSRNLWFLEFYFYFKYISNKDAIWKKKTLTGVLLEERKLNISINIEAIHNGYSKMQKYTVAGSINGFLIIC